MLLLQRVKIICNWWLSNIFLLQYNNHEIRSGKHIGVCISVANNRLFVGSIPKSKTKEQIVEEFSKVTGESVTRFYRPGRCWMWSVMSCLLAYSWMMMKNKPSPHSIYLSMMCWGLFWIFKNCCFAEGWDICN